VPYSGTGGASTDIVAGRLHGQFYQTVEALSLVRGSTSLKAIGVAPSLARRCSLIYRQSQRHCQDTKW
jgi:hypothetical protein